MKGTWSNISVLQCVSYLTRGLQVLNFMWLMKISKKKKKWRTTSNLKRYESEKKITNYVGKCNSWIKKNREDFYGRNESI